MLDLTMNLTDRPADVSFEDITRQALTEEELTLHIKRGC